MSRDEQRASTRRAIVAAAAGCLADGGPLAVTTREVAARAGIAQSTVMYHFPAKEALLVEVVTSMAETQSARAGVPTDLFALDIPERVDALLDVAWREFASPEALGAAQLWMAAWSEPSLVPVIRTVEERILAAVIGWVGSGSAPSTGDVGVLRLVDLVISTIRGLVVSVPVWGRAQVEARWLAIKPLLSATIQLELTQVTRRPGY